MIEQTINIERMEDVIDVFGSFDENIKLIESELGVSVVSRGDQLKISGEAENVMYAVKAVQGLLGLAGRKESITEQNVRYIINLVRAGNEEHINDIARDVLCVTAKGKPIKAKTLGQKRYAVSYTHLVLGRHTQADHRSILFLVHVDSTPHSYCEYAQKWKQIGYNHCTSL